MRRTAAYLTIFALMLWIAPVATLANDGGRLEGLIIGVDGRAASGHTVYLIDDQGEDAGQSVSDDDGIYSFQGVPEGNYAIGIETPEGQVAPVAAAPVQVGNGELARRDVKLVNADTTQLQQTANVNYGFGLWWAGLSGAAKAGVIIGMAAVATGIIVAVTDDDDDEPPASPM